MEERAGHDSSVSTWKPIFSRITENQPELVNQTEMIEVLSSSSRQWKKWEAV